MTETTRSDRIVSPSMQMIEGLIIPRFDPFGIPRTVASHDRRHESSINPEGLWTWLPRIGAPGEAPRPLTHFTGRIGLDRSRGHPRQGDEDQMEDELE